MLYIQHGGKIRLTRGDTAILKVPIFNEITDEEYVVAEDDTLAMTIKKQIEDEEPIVQKVLKGSNTFCIEHRDTCTLDFGAYVYDVQLTTASGEVYTVIEPASFEILTEVTY